MDIFGYYIPAEIINILAIIFGVLTTCSIVFRVVAKKKPSKMTEELITRNRSWWFIAIGVAIVVTAPPIFGTILIGYTSFVALREILSISRLREADRTAMFAAYLAVPVQYYLAYNNFYPQFLYFIPLIMFIGLPVILVMTGKTDRIGNSMSLIPSMLMLTVFMLSHIVLLYHMRVENFSVGPGGLIIFLIMLTSFNDVFQFTWGKLLGNKKIVPQISPNKTWAGFIGGVITTAFLGYFIRFLTPMDGLESFIAGLTIGVMGFVGDLIISAIKRDLRLKDTDDLIPGHGGALDRLDSIIITTPAYYHLLRYFIEH